MEICLREGTLDREIFQEIIEQNQYRLPEKFDPSDIIIDIGAHIGIFTYAVVQRGAGCVYAVEADLENYKIAVENLRGYIDQGVVHYIWRAVWRSDTDEQVLYHSGYPLLTDLVNTGGGDVIWQTQGIMVPTLSFDHLILEATEGGRKRVRLLKIDCEGSEWPILLTSNTLSLIDEICGEFHEIGGEYDTFKPSFSIGDFERFTVHDLIRFLAEKSFNVTYSRWMRPDGITMYYGLFFAHRNQPLNCS